MRVGVRFGESTTVHPGCFPIVALALADGANTGATIAETESRPGGRTTGS